MIGRPRSRQIVWQLSTQRKGEKIGFETRPPAAKETAEKIECDGEEGASGVPDAMRSMVPLLLPLGRLGTPEEAAGPLLRSPIICLGMCWKWQEGRIDIRKLADGRAAITGLLPSAN